MPRPPAARRRRLGGILLDTGPLGRHHDFRRLWAGQLVSQLGSHLTIVAVAYQAYRRSRGGQEPPVIDGLTGDQRFFLAYGQVWRSKYRDEELRALVLSNPHAPPVMRVNGAVRNVDAWYTAFSVQPGDRLYLAPEQRVKIWQ